MSSTKSNENSSECSACNGTGTINRFRKEQPEGYPIEVEVASIELCECQKEKIFEKYNASAGMKQNERARTFETAEIDLENKSAYVQARGFVEHIEHHLEMGSWLYIYGDEERAKKAGASAFGTGKSYLAHCIGNKLTERKNKAIYVTEDKLFEEIKATYNRSSEESEAQVMWRYENVPILIIDDLFKSKTTDWTEDKVFHLLNNRQQPGKVTIINSNYAPNRIELTMPKNGKAIASRILGEAILIEMIGRDRRRTEAKKRWAEANG